MSVTKEKQREEAIERLKALTEGLDLNPNILKYFEEGKLYYSYMTAAGTVGSIEEVTCKPAYEAIVKAFETKYEGYMVYHAVEDTLGMLSLFYIGCEESDWKFERPDGTYVPVKVYVFNKDKLAENEYEVEHEEFGTIEVGSLNGAIVRTE